MMTWFQKTTPIGVHVTQSGAALAQLQDAGDAYSVRALAQVDLRDLASKQGDEWDQHVAHRIRDALSRHNFSGRFGVACLSGDKLMIQNLRLPQLPPEEIPGAIEWEARERVHFPTEEYEIRYLMAGEVRQESQVKQEFILLGAAQREVHRQIKILEISGLRPVAVEIEPLAALRCHFHRKPVSNAATFSAFVHIAEEGTAVVFSEGKEISFLKTIPIGSRLLDDSVGKHLGVDLYDAARMRAALQSVHELDPHDEIHRSIIEAIRQPLESLCIETELCLRYHKVTYRNKPVTEIILSGGESCNWLGEYFHSRLGIACRLADPFSVLKEKLRICRHERSGFWITALGLSMRPQVREEAA